MTLYSTTLRRADLCRLKVRDVDSQRMMIRIDQGKGGPRPGCTLEPQAAGDSARLLALDAAPVDRQLPLILAYRLKNSAGTR